MSSKKTDLTRSGFPGRVAGFQEDYTHEGIPSEKFRGPSEFARKLYDQMIDHLAIGQGCRAYWPGEGTGWIKIWRPLAHMIAVRWLGDAGHVSTDGWYSRDVEDAKETIVKAAQFVCSPEGHKRGSGAMRELKAAIAAYRRGQAPPLTNKPARQSAKDAQTSLSTR